MKFINLVKNNIFLIFSIFFLAFIPLYPKIPLLDIQNTWVYVRIEDFLVLFAVIILAVFTLLKKASLRSPVTIPILSFWLVGLISTIWAILFIFPNSANAFPHLAVLFFLRHIEYMVVFFIGLNALKSKKDIPKIITTLALVLVIVVVYGYGQKYFGFPAFLTGNEEFAKGAPLRLSSLARITSTFAGHYDLAAWLVMIIPILLGVSLGVKKIFYKIGLIIVSFSGLMLLLLTASRVSFAVYLIAGIVIFIFMKQKKWIIPFIVVSVLLSNASQGISERFSSTITQVDLVVDARTGKAVGISKGTDDTGGIIIEDIQSTGEDLPEGTGFINFPSKQEEVKTTSKVTYKRTKISAGIVEDDIQNLEGEFVVKRALAYDVSFTTRFQGTWPRAIKAFTHNPLLGSGYSSISLASDNNYLRILGEIGILGMLVFLSIFLTYGIFVYRSMKHVDSKLFRGFVFGVSAGLIGLGLNAVLIDVFEASKVAFVQWILMGLVVGVLYKSHKIKIGWWNDIKKVLLSYPLVGGYLVMFSFFVYSRLLNNYFVGDDFTWLRWAADCKEVAMVQLSNCTSIFATFSEYLTRSDGFFYRPGTKIFFYFMYSFFWLNQAIYHATSIILHAGMSLGVFILGIKLLKNKILALYSAFIFAILSSHVETLFWISTVGYLFASLSMIFSLIFYIFYLQSKKKYLLILSIIGLFAAPLFHEMGLVTPFLLLSFEKLVHNTQLHKMISSVKSYILLIPIPVFLLLRSISNSHWSGGDYSYNFLKLPFNIVGNLFGYLGVDVFGPSFLYYYDYIRGFARENEWIVFVFTLVAALVGYIKYKYIFSKFTGEKKRVIIFSIFFYILGVAPFLGFGNISLRYVYIASVPFVFLIIFLLDEIVSKLIGSNRLRSGVLLVLLLFFGIYHFNQIVKNEKDWDTAGEISYNVIVGLYEYFPASKATPPNPVFYFVDTPIKYNNAWVFPVGLDDALWFSFQNENLTTHLSPDLETAFKDAEGSLSARIFQFNKNGKIEEVSKEIEIIHED